MNWIETLLKEHSKRQRDKIVRHIGINPKRFAELVGVFLTGPYRVTQRASWPLSVCVEKHPSLIVPHLNKIVKNLSKPHQHDAVKRNTLRLLQFVDIPKRNQAEVADVCFELLTDKKQAVAVHVFAMQVLANLAKKIPELKNELIPIIEDRLPYAKPAFISRGKRVLKELTSTFSTH